MALKNYAYYDTQSGLIENVILLDDEHLNDLIDYPPQGFAIQEIPEDFDSEGSVISVGWSYIDGQFVAPPAPPQPVQPTVDGGVETL